MVGLFTLVYHDCDSTITLEITKRQIQTQFEYFVERNRDTEIPLELRSMAFDCQSTDSDIGDETDDQVSNERDGVSFVYSFFHRQHR